MKTTIVIIIIFLTCRTGYSQNIDSLRVTPNPFSTATCVYYGLANNDTVSIYIYNRWGQNVKTIMHDSLINSGNYSICFQADSLAIGIYVVQLKLGTHKTIIKNIIKTGDTAKSYFNFPNSNTVWTYLQCDYHPINPTPYESCHTQYYTLSGDTVINSLIYHKIYHGTVPNQLGNYYAAVREDSLKKVYVIPMGTTEYLKFNFSGAIGDTMEVNQKIIAIDSVLISGSYHDRFILSSNDTIIEGIGNINKIIGFYATPDGVRFILLCMTTNNNSIYQNLQYQTCDTTLSIILSVNNPNEIDTYFKIYPNPVQSQLNIEFDATGTNNTIIEIKNVLGKTIYSESIKTIGNIQSKNIDLFDLSNGVYFLQLKSENKVICKKFVKQEL